MSVTKVHVCKLIGKGIYEIEDHINNPSVFHYSYKKKMHKDKDFFSLTSFLVQRSKHLTDNLTNTLQ
jgi:hypothetical protein